MIRVMNPTEFNNFIYKFLFIYLYYNKISHMQEKLLNYFKKNYFV